MECGSEIKVKALQHRQVYQLQMILLSSGYIEKYYHYQNHIHCLWAIIITCDINIHHLFLQLSYCCMHSSPVLMHRYRHSKHGKYYTLPTTEATYQVISSIPNIFNESGHTILRIRYQWSFDLVAVKTSTALLHCLWALNYNAHLA